MKTSTATAEHYAWGANCEGWHLLKSDSLSVIQERMPPNTSEQRHFHRTAQQYFYVLSGCASMELEGETVELQANEGIHIAANKRHQIFNKGTGDLHFLVISEPKAQGDRVEV